MCSVFSTLNIHQPRSTEGQEEHSSWPPLLLSTPLRRCHAHYHHALKFKKIQLSLIRMWMH